VQPVLLQVIERAMVGPVLSTVTLKLLLVLELEFASDAAIE
jgi:hypothetical protein